MVASQSLNERLLKRRHQYRARKRMLIDLGILVDRKPGRPRLRSPATARAIAKSQRHESDKRMRLHIKQELDRLRLLNLDANDEAVL